MCGVLDFLSVYFYSCKKVTELSNTFMCIRNCKYFLKINASPYACLPYLDFTCVGNTQSKDLASLFSNCLVFNSAKKTASA